MSIKVLINPYTPTLKEYTFRKQVLNIWSEQGLARALQFIKRNKSKHSKFFIDLVTDEIKELEKHSEIEFI